jgi:hypothetical protein
VHPEVECEEGEVNLSVAMKFAKDHQEWYDSDCAEHFGCRCGWKPKDKIRDNYRKCGKAFRKHLAKELVKLVDKIEANE